MLEVPNKDPMKVPIASANRALSILEEKPEEFSRAASSSAEKIPVFRPVPIKVPIVSNVSDKLNAKMVIKTSGRRPTLEKSDPRPPNAARKVVPNSFIAEPI